MKKLILLFTFGTIVIAKAQDISPHVVNSTGNQFINSNFSLDYAVGEIVISTLSNASYQLTQGFLQSNVNATLTGITAINRDTDVLVYPNPTENEIYIESTNANTIDVYNQLGLLVATYKMNDKVTLSHLSSGIYILKIYNTQNQLIKIYKITKI
jgi:hypothetical protein